MLAAGLASLTCPWGSSALEEAGGQQRWLQELSLGRPSALGKEEEGPKERKMECIARELHEAAQSSWARTTSALLQFHITSKRAQKLSCRAQRTPFRPDSQMKQGAVAKQTAPDSFQCDNSG